MLWFCVVVAFFIPIATAAPRRNLAKFEDLGTRLQPAASDLLEDPTSILLPFFRPGALANPSSFLNKLTASGNTLDISQFLDSDFLQSFKSKEIRKESKPLEIQSDLPADKDIGRVFASALKNLFRRTQLTQLEDFQHSAASQLNGFFTQIQSMTNQFGSLFGNNHFGLPLATANVSTNTTTTPVYRINATDSTTISGTTTDEQQTTTDIPFVFADAPKSQPKAPTKTVIVGKFPEISLSIDAEPHSFQRDADTKPIPTGNQTKITDDISGTKGNSTAPKIVTVDLNDFVTTAEFLSDLLKEKGGLKSLMDLINDPVARQGLIPGL